VLDSEVLGRVVETGVFGLVAFLLIGVSVVFVARSTIASRAVPDASLALIGAAAAVCFLVGATLFDVLGYPHVTYVFLYIAGLTAAVVQRPSPARKPPAPRRVE
jgi:O-antigen ligase